MKRILGSFLGLALGTGLTWGNLFAETVRGEVTAINKEIRSVTILQKDSAGEPYQNKEFILRPDAKFIGAQSFGGLEVGDEIQADVNPRMFRKDEVKLLITTKTKAMIETNRAKNKVESRINRGLKQVSLAVPKRISGGAPPTGGIAAQRPPDSYQKPLSSARVGPKQKGEDS